MAHALQIDTLAFTKKLREAGAEEGLAEAIVEGLTAADTSELATKGDVAEVRTEIAEVKTEIAEVKSELKTEIAEVKTEIAEVKSELKTEIVEVKTEIAEVKSELKTEIAEVKSELKTEIVEAKSEFKQDLLKVEKKIDKVDVDLNWIKIMGGTIIAVLILPWLTELAKSIMN